MKAKKYNYVHIDDRIEVNDVLSSDRFHCYDFNLFKISKLRIPTAIRSLLTRLTPLLFTSRFFADCAIAL